MYADFNVPFEEFAALTGKSKCMRYPAMLPWRSLRSRIHLNQPPLTQANQRALATRLYGAGADGIAIYNHFTTMWHPPFYPQSLRFFREPQRIADGTRHYVFEPTWADSEGFGLDKPSTGFVKAQRAILNRKEPKARGTYQFRLFDNLSDCQATLTFRGFHLSGDDEVAVTLNGHAVNGETIGHIAARDVPRDRRNLTRAGRTYLLAPAEGRIEFRKGSTDAAISKPDSTFSTRWFDLRDLPIRRGINHLSTTFQPPFNHLSTTFQPPSNHLSTTFQPPFNHLSITLNHSDPLVKKSIVIDEVEVWVQP